MHNSYMGDIAMHIYGPSRLYGPHCVTAPHGDRAAQAMARPEADQVADEVDISERAKGDSPLFADTKIGTVPSQLVELSHRLSDIRQQRVIAVRQQIVAGMYETSDKLNVAVERLLDEIA